MGDFIPRWTNSFLNWAIQGFGALRIQRFERGLRVMLTA